jgi:hypothetical protein
VSIGKVRVCRIMCVRERESACVSDNVCKGKGKCVYVG